MTPSIGSYDSCSCRSVCRVGDCRNGLLNVDCAAGSYPHPRLVNDDSQALASRPLSDHGLMNDERLAIARHECIESYGLVSTVDSMRGR